MKQHKILLASLLALGFLALYLQTLSPSLFWGDGMELTGVARTLGIAHPTGYPLFTLLARLSQGLPFGEVAWRSNLFCALTIICLLITSFFLLLFLSSLLWPQLSHTKRLFLAVLATIILGLLYSPWHHSSFTEVYALNTLFTALILYLLLNYWQQGNDRLLWLAALLFVLALTHHFLVTGLLPLLVWFFLARFRPEGVDHLLRRALPRLLALLVLALSLYLFLHIRAHAHPPYQWGTPDTLSRLGWLITGGDFRQERFLKEDPAHYFTLSSYLGFLQDRMESLFLFTVAQAMPPQFLPLALKWLFFLALLALFLYGAVLLARSSTTLLVLFLVPLAVNLLYIMLYNIADIEDYYLGVVWLGWLLGALAAISILARINSRLPLVLVACFPFLLLLHNFPRVDKSTYTLPANYGRRILRIVPPHSLIITAGDNDIFSLWYAQQVESLRPDVIVFGGNFISSPWYEAYVRPYRARGLQYRLRSQVPFTSFEFYHYLAEQLIRPNLDRFPVFVLHPHSLYQHLFQLSHAEPLIYKSDLESYSFVRLPSPALFSVKKTH